VLWLRNDQPLQQPNTLKEFAVSSVKHVSKQSFATEVLRSSVPVIVDFYADWCGPCRLLAPRLERLSDEFAGRVKIVKVNIDVEPELATAVAKTPHSLSLVDS
jgi:thioredoxin-like negative regulator of GroEL